MSSKYLIVNADDFGLSAGVNEGVAQTHERGILTSASLMVRWPEAEAAAAYARLHPRLSVGLHLDLGEWTFAEEEWRLAYEVVPLTNLAAVCEEVERQLDRFRALMGTEPTHLDSHQHVHLSEEIRDLCATVAARLRVPLRKVNTEIHYCGEFYGQSNKGYPYPEGISVPALVKLIANLPQGTTEMACHPALRADMAGMYRNERTVESATLCDPAVLKAIQDHQIKLRSFRDYRALGF